MYFQLITHLSVLKIISQIIGSIMLAFLNFNKHSGKCEYCQILGCKKGLYEHNFNKYSGKCNYCGQINQNNF